MWREKEQNLDYGSVYRPKPGMFESRRELWKFVILVICGLGGWVMAGLLIWWAVKG